MQGTEKQTWQEQLSTVRSAITPHSDEEEETAAILHEGSDVIETDTLTDLPKLAKPAIVPKQPTGDSVEAAGGKLTVKSPGGEVVIPLTPAAEAEFVARALQYQKAMISEKKANVFATYAMAALSGLSAVAIGVTLIGSTLSKNKSSLM